VKHPWYSLFFLGLALGLTKHWMLLGGWFAHGLLSFGHVYTHTSNKVVDLWSLLDVLWYEFILLNGILRVDFFLLICILLFVFSLWMAFRVDFFLWSVFCCLTFLSVLLFVFSLCWIILLFVFFHLHSFLLI
jgi:hypothetical protein